MVYTFTRLLLCTALLLLAGCALDCARERPRDETAFEQGMAAPELREGDTWLKDGALEIFLRAALSKQNVATVAARYGLQCLPRSEAAGCSDCYTCRTSVKQWRFGQMSIPLPSLALKCVDYGEVLVQAEIGPGSSVKAMTYWKTSPEAREGKKRARSERQ